MKLLQEAEQKRKAEQQAVLDDERDDNYGDQGDTF